MHGKCNTDDDAKSEPNDEEGEWFTSPAFGPAEDHPGEGVALAAPAR